ncbi:MAG: hypothetical protein AB7E96_08225 [Deferribacterales bacterium]
MLKIFPVLMIAMMLMTGCVDKAVTLLDDSTTVVNNTVGDIIDLNTGYFLVLASIEINSNISSLLIDKTKEKITAYDSAAAKTLEPGRFIYIVPPRITDSGGKYYFDTQLKRQLTNFLAMGKYAIPVDDINQADYIAVMNIRESFERRHGTNFSSVSFSIMNKLDMPVFISSVRVESSSDRNFWYYSEKDARPVRTLTMKGISYILTKGLPEAHGEPSDLQKAMAKAKEMYLTQKENLAQQFPEEEK